MLNYSVYAKNYDNRYTTDMCLQENAAIYEALKKIHKIELRYILDLGCGTGFLLDLMQNEIDDQRYLGIDISSKMIEVARQKYPKKLFIVDDCKNVTEHVRQYEFKPDLAISFFSIPYIGVETIKAVYSILDEKGKFLAVYYNKPYINPMSVYYNKESNYKLEVKPKIEACIKCLQNLYKMEFSHLLTDTHAYNIALFSKN